MNFLRRLTHRPSVIAVAQRLGIAGPLRQMYYGMVSPADGAFQTTIEGIPLSFSVANASELRMLEGLTIRNPECFVNILLSTLKPGDVFYDVGSNIGEYAILAAKIVGKEGHVVAFEPSRRSFERLVNNIAINGLSNVRAYPVALGDHSHRATLVLGGFLNRESRLGETEGPDAIPESHGQPTEVVSGDAFCAAERLRPPNAVKIDVEGYESPVLKGLEQLLRSGSCRLLCCEVHCSRGISPEALCEQIRSLGFVRQEQVRRGGELHVIATRA